MIMLRIFLVLVSLFLVSCGSLRESPAIYFSNASNDAIANIECLWPNKMLLTLATLNPGDSRTQSIYLKRDSQFFGPVHISWYNSKGEKIVRNFNFKKENLPSIADRDIYSYVQFYFIDDDLDVMTSDGTDVGGKVRRMERLMAKYGSEFRSTNSQVSTSLIRAVPITQTW
jgi:hypothetical protein